jgi:hypothetical protein
MKQNNEWVIDDDGNIGVPDTLYWIEKNELHRPDWLLHLTAKKWFDANKFLPVYFEACKKAGIQKVKIFTHY